MLTQPFYFQQKNLLEFRGGFTAKKIYTKKAAPVLYRLLPETRSHCVRQVRYYQ
jgi:hypothetical protein